MNRMTHACENETPYAVGNQCKQITSNEFGNGEVEGLFEILPAEEVFLKIFDKNWSRYRSII